MRFVNRSKRNIHVRVGERFNFSWISVKPGETIDLPEDKGKRFGLVESNQELPEVTEGKIGDKKVETKQVEKKKDDAGFYKELIKIKGIAWKTAEDIMEIFTKENLIEAIIKKEKLPFRNDIEEKLRKEYGK